MVTWRQWKLTFYDIFFCFEGLYFNLNVVTNPNNVVLLSKQFHVVLVSYFLVTQA